MTCLSPRMRAVIVDHAAPGGLILSDVELPRPGANEAVVRVAAMSLNRDEIDRCLTGREYGARPGCDFAGTIALAAADRSGLELGARVVGLLRSGAWAEYVVVPSDMLAEIPASVNFATAAALPSAGLTALQGLGYGGLLVAKRVLVADATSGAGLFAVQLARASGAGVVAAITRPEHEALLEEYGADHVIVGDATNSAQFDDYHLIFDTAKWPTSMSALGLLRRGGTYVLHGSDDASEATIDCHAFFATKGIRLFGYNLFDVMRHEPISDSLGLLLTLARTNMLQPCIEFEGNWTDVGGMARRLKTSPDIGAAVLHV